MKKIITLFQRNYTTDMLVRDEVVPGAEWVLAGEGVATRKYNGTCCLAENGILYKRYILRPPRQAPKGFIAAQDPDPVTQEIPGWVPIRYGPEDRWHREALELHNMNDLFPLPNGTYELCGPKIQGNPEGFDKHVLVPHGSYVIPDCPRTFQALAEFLRECPFEGIVWYHEDGRMAKIKRRDFFKSRLNPASDTN